MVLFMNHKYIHEHIILVHIFYIDLYINKNAFLFWLIYCKDRMNKLNCGYKNNNLTILKFWLLINKQVITTSITTGSRKITVLFNCYRKVLLLVFQALYDLSHHRLYKKDILLVVVVTVEQFLLLLFWYLPMSYDTNFHFTNNFFVWICEKFRIKCITNQFFKGSLKSEPFKVESNVFNCTD